MLSIKQCRDLIDGSEKYSDEKIKEIRDDLQTLAEITIEQFLVSQRRLVEAIKKEFKLDINSIHGIKHWNNVARIGSYLVERTKADFEVVHLFAYTHDSKRENENADPEHGSRAALFARELLQKGVIKLPDNKLDKLCFACENHANSEVKSDDITIQTCWDADRLDFWRLGIMPDKRHLNTDIAKTQEALELSREFNYE